MPDQPSRRTHSAESARQAILAAAEDHFARFGFSGARIEAIAESAGYNKSLIFHYFTDKLGLYQAVVECAKRNQDSFDGQTFLALAHDEERPLTPTLVRQFIEAAVRFSFDLMLKKPNLRRILLWEAAEGWQAYGQTHHLPANVTAQQSAGVRFIQRAQAAGIVRAELDPRLLVTFVMGLTLIHLSSLPRYAMIFPDQDFHSEAALAHVREQLVEIVVQGTMLPFVEDDTHAV